MSQTFRPRKRFGQHFLYDPAIARKIVTSANLGPSAAVIELGAGRGILTRALADTGASVIALEIDRDLFAGLEATFGSGSKADRVEVLNVDFTKVSITSILAERGIEGCVLFGNIPYHLTRDVLFSFLVDEHEMLEGAFLMMQREVGERIVSPPGSRVYGITSVILQSLYRVRMLFRVSPGSFNPRPTVDSIVLGFQSLDVPLVRSDELKRFVSLVKNLFQQRRKTIHNTIRSFYSLSDNELKTVRRTTGIDLESRPEALAREDFLQLSRVLADMTADN